MHRTHVVYRCYAADGELLYVGRTSNLRSRCYGHQSTPWWPMIVKTTSTRLMTAAASRRYERIAIRTETPKYNVMPMLAAHGTAGRIDWHGCRCQVCRDGRAMRQRRYRARRFASLREDPTLAPHGRASTYSNWGCRCDPCTAANRKRVAS